MKSGTPLVVVIWPERRRVWEYRFDDVKEVTEVITAAISELDLDVKAMWATVGSEEL